MPTIRGDGGGNASVSTVQMVGVSRLSSTRVYVQPPVDARSGTGSATLTLTAASTGVKSVARTGTAGFTLTVSDTGRKNATGPGSCAFTLTAASTGAKSVARTGVATLTLTAASTGRKNGSGTSSVPSFTVTVADTGRKNGAGSGTAGFTLTTASTGTRGADSRSGTGSATFTLTASATGAKASSGTGGDSGPGDDPGDPQSAPSIGGGWPWPNQQPPRRQERPHVAPVLIRRSGTGTAGHVLTVTSVGSPTRSGAARIGLRRGVVSSVGARGGFGTGRPGGAWTVTAVARGAKGSPGAGSVRGCALGASSSGATSRAGTTIAPHSVTRAATGRKSAYASTRGAAHIMTTASVGVGDQARRRRRQDDELLLILS